jgi:hypothetical protein
MTTVANERLLFVHIPKTAGTWVAEAMAAAGLECDPVGADVHPKRRELPQRPFTFAFVREPISWYRSLWRFHRRLPQSGWKHLDELFDLDLPEFLEQVATRHPGWLTTYYELFVGPPEDQIDYVGCQENVRSELVAALTAAGVRFDPDVIFNLPARNYSGERQLYGTLDPPRPQMVVPAEILALVVDAEHEIYDRYYGGQRPQAQGEMAPTERRELVALP